MLQGLKREKELLTQLAQVFQCSFKSTDAVSKDVAIPARSGKTWPLVLAISSHFKGVSSKSTKYHQPAELLVAIVIPCSLKWLLIIAKHILEQPLKFQLIFVHFSDSFHGPYEVKPSGFSPLQRGAEVCF